MATATQQKTLGAFYTADPIARFLVNWAVRKPSDNVLDPSCGDGAFIVAAVERILSLGNTSPNLWGVDINATALRSAALRSTQSSLIQRSFFSLKPGDVPPMSAIVGNPPFIRYQTFSGARRAEALKCALDAGVTLPELCSSWAPFLVHATAFLQEGGRLAVVAPSELAHAKYAREVLRFLLRKFERISVRMFQTKMFAELSEDTVLLLCDNYGKSCDWLSVASSASISEAPLEEKLEIPANIEAIKSGRHRLTRYLLPAKALDLYENMAEQEGVEKLGDCADVGIGYVTGCNDYFHLTADEASVHRIPSRYLKPALLSLGDFSGTVFRRSDWEQLLKSRRKAYLLEIPSPRTHKPPRGLSEYLGLGAKEGVPGHFKCRVRSTWYSVPHVRVGHAFLSYMSGATPKLVANGAALVAPNTLHIVRFRSGRHWRPLVAGWCSSLTRLSCELEGHALGGGMLKLEPTEAKNVLVAMPKAGHTAALLTELDRLLRAKDLAAAADLADQSILRCRFGLSKSECMTLRNAATQLENWRLHK